jgi:hypothetical protein
MPSEHCACVVPLVLDFIYEMGTCPQGKEALEVVPILSYKLKANRTRGKDKRREGGGWYLEKNRMIELEKD